MASKRNRTTRVTELADPAADRIARRLAAWYRQNARDLPWRLPPGSRARPDPYRVWLSEVMLQQTTVAAVLPYYRNFTARWPDVAALAAAPDAEIMAAWAGLGYYARARNLLKCARIVAGPLEGRFPDTLAGLLELPGIGPYTGAAIAAIAFGRPEAVVDGNVERVIARLFSIDTPLPAARPAIREHAARLTPATNPGDHAQAMMDLGATVCTPRAPRCSACPLAADCLARQRGLAETLPRRPRRKALPRRRGLVYVARRTDGALLLETRPETAMLGGMPGFPGSDWSADPAPAPPLAADWQPVPPGVQHVFTHFRLHLTVLRAEVPSGATPERGAFVLPGAFDPRSLPTLMRKVHDLALADPQGVQAAGR